MKDAYVELEKIKHCLTCGHYDEGCTIPDWAETFEDVIPTPYCKFHKAEIEDGVETCENYK